MPTKEVGSPTVVRMLFGSFELNVEERSLRKADEVIPIGGRAFDILVTLLERNGEVVTNGELIEKVWSGVTVEEGSVRVHLSTLRKALSDGHFGDRYIANVKGRGYCFVAPVTRQAAEKPNANSFAQSLNVGQPPGGKTRPTPRRGNVSASLVELVGHTNAVVQVEQLVLAHRIVTLVGPGGIGKTTLAQEVASRLIDRFDGESWLVELASLSDPALVPSTVARTLGLRLGAEEITAEAVARAIGDRTFLLVVDNCEHLIEAVTNLIATVARACPGASILATSREFLRIEGERIYRVPPLEVPSDHPTADDILQHSAVQLLIARTKALNLDFAPREAQFRLLAAISRRLDGIPLAIELVAARVAVLGLEHVAASLGDQLGVLTAGYRTAAPRHQTLRATLDWSYGLLSSSEQWLLRNLAVFQGGFTIDSAIDAFGTEHPASEITEGITLLLTKSLIPSYRAEGRWQLLDTTRAYAVEKLQQADEINGARHRHAKYFRSFVLAKAEASVATPDALVATGRDIDNVRAALDWAYSTSGDPQIGIALTAAYIPVWFHFALIGECRERIEQALKCPAASIDTNARNRMQLNAGRAWTILMSRSSCPETVEGWTEALKIAEALADVNYQLKALWGLFIEQITADCHTALRIAERFKTIAESTDRADVLIGHRLIGTALHGLGRQPEARLHIERFFADDPALINRRSDALRFQWDQGVAARSNQARILWLQGYPDEAIQAAADAVRVAQALDHPASLALALYHGACPVALLAANLPAAESWVRTLLDLSVKHAMDPWRIIGQCFMGMFLIKKNADRHQSIGMIRAALSELPENAFYLNYAQILSDLAEALGLMRQPEQALAALDPAFARCDRTAEGWYVPELMRVKGEMLLQKRGSHADDTARDNFLKAFELAGQQGALSWQLRAAISLVRMRPSNVSGRHPLRLLRQTYDKFTEGFETNDLVSAKHLLERG